MGASAKPLVRRYRSAGMEGLEAITALCTRRQRSQWVALAEQEDLVVTAGSDFHGALFPHISDVGMELPEPHAARLRDWLQLERGPG